jgi:hypothetical protein
MKIKILFIGISFLFVSCQIQPKSIVEEYLKTIKSGDIQKQKELSCVLNSANTEPIITAPAWTIIGEEERTTDSSSPPILHYQVVTIDINGTNYRIDVWKTEEAYKDHISFSEKLAAMSYGSKYKKTSQDRSEWTSKEICIGLIRNLSDNSVLRH